MLGPFFRRHDFPGGSTHWPLTMPRGGVLGWLWEVGGQEYGLEAEPDKRRISVSTLRIHLKNGKEKSRNEGVVLNDKRRDCRVRASARPRGRVT